MKKALFLSHSLITGILREQCSEVANLFDNSLTPTTEQIEDLHEITRAWLADMPDSYQEKFNHGFETGFEMAQQLSELDAEKEAVDPTPGPGKVEAKPEADVEEDPFRYHVTAVEIKAGSPIPFVPLAGLDFPEIPDSSNSSENSNSSNDSEAGVTNPTNLIDNPVEKNSQPTNSSVVTVEDVKAAVAEHGAESFAEFCKIPLWSAKGNLGKVIDRGVAGPKTVAWIKSLRGNQKADTKKSENLTEPPKPVSERIAWARAREICRVRTAETKPEIRLLESFINSGAIDVDWWLKQTFAFDSFGVLIP